MNHPSFPIKPDPKRLRQERRQLADNQVRQPKFFSSDFSTVVHKKQPLSATTPTMLPDIDEDKTIEGFSSLKQGDQEASRFRGLYLLAFMAALSPAVMSGCATINRHEAAKAYKSGDFLTAKNLYAQSAKDLTEQERQKLAMIEKGVGEDTVMFLNKAKNQEASRLFFRNNYPEALRFYQLAFKRMKPDHPDYELAKTRILELESMIQKLKDGYKTRKKKLESIFQNGDFVELAQTIEFMRQVRLALNFDPALNEAGTLASICASYASRYLAQGEYKEAKVFFNMLPPLLLQGETISEEALAATQAAERFLQFELDNEARDELKEMVEEFLQLKANASSSKEDLVKLAEDILENPFVDEIDPAIKKQAQAIREENERKLSEQLKANRRAEAKRRMMLASLKAKQKAEKEVKSMIIKAAEPEAPTSNGVKAQLRNAQGLMDIGQTYDAIIALQNALKKNPGDKSLLKQQSEWEGKKAQLIQQKLKEADRLFTEEDEDALEVYQELLALNPDKKTVDHAKRRIGILNDILKNKTHE